MCKLIVSMNISLDGFMADRHGGLDWHIDHWTSEMADTLYGQLIETDALLFGRITYCAMAEYWGSKQHEMYLSREDLAYVQMLSDCNKIVFSKTLKAATWGNSHIVSGDVQQEALRIKQQARKNIMLFGSGQLVQALMRWKLIDEYRLWVHPVMLGSGRALFKNIQSVMQQAKQLHVFDSGVMLVNYRVADVKG